MVKDNDWHLVTTTDKIKSHEALPVLVGDVEIALCSVGDNIYAFNNICTHEYACMSDGFIDDDVIECPMHQARFHIPTGKVVSPPADIDLDIYQVKVIETQVYVEIPK